MSDTNSMHELIIAAGMATACGLISDELPKSSSNLKVLKSANRALNRQHPQPNSDSGSSLNNSLSRMAAWFKSPGQHSKSATS